MYHRTCYKQTKINLKQIKKLFYIFIKKGFSTSLFYKFLYAKELYKSTLVKVEINTKVEELTSQ